MRARPSQHLSQPGVSLARSVGQELDPFDLVITSTLPRAYETAIAMGFAVDEQLEQLASLPEGFEGEVRWDEGFQRFAMIARCNPEGTVARYMRILAELHRRIVSDLPAPGRALLVSHGGIVEASAVGCKPDQAFDSWGPASGYCEGVKLYFKGILCVRAEPLRVHQVV